MSKPASCGICVAFMSLRRATDAEGSSAPYDSPAKAIPALGARAPVEMVQTTILLSAADAVPPWWEREEAQFTVTGPAECEQCERKSGTAKISLTRPYKTRDLQTRIRGLTTETAGRARMRTNSRGLRETMNAKTQSDRTPRLET